MPYYEAGMVRASTKIGEYEPEWAEWNVLFLVAKLGATPALLRNME